MIVLMLDAQNNRIVIEDNEVQPGQTFHLTEGEGNQENLVVTLSDDETRFFKVNIGQIDFEGMVFKLIDRDGNKWMTEIIGSVAVKDNG